MSKEIEAELERKSISKSAKNRLSKIGTGIKSAAEYGLVDGVGKTIKNFAIGVSSGAKQGYSYFNNNISKDLAKLEELVDEQIKEANKSLPSTADKYTDLSQDESYKKLGFKKRLDLLAGVIDDTTKTNQKKPTNDKSLANAEMNEKLGKLEEIVKAHVLIKSLNKMYEKSPEGRKIEQYKSVLNNQLNTLADKVSIINEPEYKAAQTYEEKIKLIKDKSQLLQKALTSETISTEPNSRTNQGQINSESITNTGRLYTMAEETFALLKAAEEQLLNPKQNPIVRTLKTAAGVIAGATIGALRGSGSAIKTAAKAVKNAPTGIKKTYQKNRGKKQHTR